MMTQIPSMPYAADIKPDFNQLRNYIIGRFIDQLAPIAPSIKAEVIIEGTTKDIVARVFLSDNSALPDPAALERAKEIAQTVRNELAVTVIKH